MTIQRLPLVLIAAVARNGVIGRDGGLPWHLPGDLAHFRDATMGKPVIMGRKTFEAIGRPLPGRFLVIVSGSTRLAQAGVDVADSFEHSIEKAQAIGLRQGSEAVMVAGGGSIYRAAMNAADALLITDVALSPSGDTRFPPIEPGEWHVVERGPERRLPGDEAAYAFVTHLNRRHGDTLKDSAA